MVMVEIGGKITKTYPFGMTENLICLAVGSGELIWGLLLKFMPLKLFQCINFDEKPMTADEEAKSLKGRLKGGTSLLLKEQRQSEIKDNISQNLADRFKRIN